MTDIIAQVLSIVAMLLAIFAFQFKSNKKFCICQAASSTAFALSYIILNAMTGAMSNMVNIFRGFSFGLAPRKYRNISLIILEILYIIVGIATYQNIYSLLILGAQVVGTLSIWYDNGKIIRIIQFFWICPIWLIYNIVYFSLGGILCECFTLISILISFCRYGIDGFEK